MALIDLRSDTVTKPTDAMRRAMAAAEVGDDVFGDDPTVNELEERAADLLGKEAALFVASGSMGNLVSQMALVPRGGEVIAGTQTHAVMDEAASHAVVTGASVRVIDERPDGTIDLEKVRDAFRDPTDLHEPISSLVSIENSHAHSGGQPITVAYTSAIAAVAHEHGVPLFVDGARFWNAAVALGVTGRELAAPADMLSFCLSKGLGCPVGSIVVGRKDDVWKARRARKLVGGGMRQVGILAAAGLVALRTGPDGMIDRLAEDHANARRLAEGLAELPGIRSPGDIAQPEPGPLDPDRFRTNFVLFKVAADRAAFIDAMASRGILVVAYPHGQVRAVTHVGVEQADIDRTIAAARDVLADLRGGQAREPAGQPEPSAAAAS
ncbi:MAG TPA: GntG family PLP-dependent aldolase [Candidatus Limnocylindrales bacterium]|nr:GntG family PLP-dependent aldolase [Candidatus Limnocylindrales bacterium]